MPSEAELERLTVKVNGDASGYRKAMEDVRSQTNLTDGHIQFATKRIQAFGLSLRGYGASAAAAILPLVGAAGLVGSAFKGIGLAAEFEKSEIAFGTLLQSAEQGKILMKDIAKLAADTPMGQMDLQRGAKMLLQFGESADKVIPTLRRLGDVAGGDSTLMQRLALAYGQVRGVGHVQGDELNQMLEAGFNPMREMARTRAGGQQGKMEGAAFEGALQEIQKLKEHGGVTFKMLEDAFKSATSEGGQFYDGMKRMAGGLAGLYSTMQDDIDTSLREIGQSLVDNLNLKDFVKEVSANAQAVGEWFKSINPEIKKMAAAVGVATAAFVGFAAVLAITGIAFNVLVGGIGLVSGLILGLVGAAVAFGTVWVMRVGSVHEAFTKAKAAVKEFVDTNYDLIVQAGLVAAGVFAVVSAVKILVGTFLILKGLYVALHIQQAIMLALWVAWKIAVLAATAVWMLFNAQVVVYNAAITVGTAVTGLFSGGMTGLSVVLLVAKGAIWLVNAALAVMNSLLAPVYIAAAVGTIVALYMAYQIVEASVKGVVGATSALIDLLGSNDALAGPVQHVSEMFGEWYSIIKDVLRALTVDSRLAMELLGAGGKLAISQLRDALPPLWAFMRDGFAAVAEYWGDVLTFETAHAIGQMGDEEFQEEKERSRKITEMRLAMLAARFKVEDSEETKNARKRVSEIRDEIKLAFFNRDAPGALGGVLAGVTGDFQKLKAGAKSSKDEMDKVKQTIASFSGQSLVGSAADKMKLQAALYSSGQARGWGTNGPASLGTSAGVVGGALGGGAVPVLQQIRDLIAKQNQDMKDQGGFIMLPANLGR